MDKMNRNLGLASFYILYFIIYCSTKTILCILRATASLEPSRLHLFSHEAKLDKKFMTNKNELMVHL